MNYTLHIVWGTLITGAVASIFVGRNVKGVGRTLAIALGLGFVLTLVLNIALPQCARVKLCPALGDTGIIYALAAVFAIPFNWLLMMSVPYRRPVEALSE